MSEAFFVIDGTDGSGKKTQTDLLVQRLEQDGYKVARIDFPQYGEKSAALVEQYLNGEFGTADEVGPYRASVFYACDRYAASFRVRQWLDQGYVVIANRYVSSNMGHQGGKIDDPGERQEFFDWLEHLEFEIFSIPRPTMVCFLNVPAAVGQQLVGQKEQREYIQEGNQDIHEMDEDHLSRAEQVYRELSERYETWQKLDCVDENGHIQSKQSIHEKLWCSLRPYLKRE